MWFDDEIAPGVNRAEGNKNMWQLRIVAPLTKEQSSIGIQLLPRLTFRNHEAPDGSSGAGNAELFVLTIPKERSKGRFGIGPQINFPADQEQFGSKEWRYGLATAALHRAAQDKMLLGILIQQIWGKEGGGSDVVRASPITIQPVLNYGLPKQFHFNIGETALSYHWQAKEWRVPIRISPW